MKEIDEFLQILMEHISDDRIKVTKRMKYGYRYYYIRLFIDEKPEDSLTTSPFDFKDSVDITIDNRNLCIELSSDPEHIIIEDKELVEKWSNILENHLNKNLSEKVKNIIKTKLSNCYRKDIYRTYQMKKILPE